MLLNEQLPAVAPRPRDEVAGEVVDKVAGEAVAADRADTGHIPEPARSPDHWPDLDLNQPLPPEPVDGLLDLLAPVLDTPVLVVDQPSMPQASDLAALHRAELEADFAKPPPARAGDEPAIPPQFAARLSMLPHIDFPT